MKKILLHIILPFIALLATSCDKFLDDRAPQGAVDESLLDQPEQMDALVVAAYAIWISAEDINSSFSMWNYDVRSDDAYKGGNGTEDGDVFHALEVSQGIITTAWNISDIWLRLYNALSRVNLAIEKLEKQSEDSYPLKQQRLAEMRFLRGHGHFLLKRLFKHIVFVDKAGLTQAEYEALTNTSYTNDEGWQAIASDFLFAYDHLPAVQSDKGRPTKAAAAAYLAKTYLYKAYRQDDPATNAVTSINADDLAKVVEYTAPSVLTGYALEADFHNNFRPEPQYENGIESIWAMQYSSNDGTNKGNCNWAYGLIVPNIPGVTDGGCDFYKPSQNLVNAFRTDDNGFPYYDSFNSVNFEPTTHYCDPRLFLTVGLPGFPYEFNSKYKMEKSSVWSRSNGLYGYYVSLKHNVDPDSGYLIKGSYWGSPMNRIVLRYADILLMRAEALIQLNRPDEAMPLINLVRGRAAASTSLIAGYAVKGYKVSQYTGTFTKDEALKRLKFERRLELAMESDRFFDLVRWGEAEPVLNAYYRSEQNVCSIYNGASFTADKNEYLPIPHAQMSASNGHYTQNCGWK